MQKAFHDLIQELKAALPAVFESEDYQKQRASVEQAIQAKGQAAFAALTEKATAKNIAILRTPTGFTLAPMKDGKIVPPAEFNAWPRDQQLAVQQAIQSLEGDLEERCAACRGWKRNSATRSWRWNEKPLASRSRHPVEPVNDQRSPTCLACWRISTI